MRTCFHRNREAIHVPKMLTHSPANPATPCNPSRTRTMTPESHGLVPTLPVSDSVQQQGLSLLQLAQVSVPLAREGLRVQGREGSGPPFGPPSGSGAPGPAGRQSTGKTSSLWSQSSPLRPPTTDQTQTHLVTPPKYLSMAWKPVPATTHCR